MLKKQLDYEQLRHHVLYVKAEDSDKRKGTKPRVGSLVLIRVMPEFGHLQPQRSLDKSTVFSSL